VLRSPWYLVFRCVLQLTALRRRSNDFKELEIIVLRHELDILRRQTRRATVTTVDRLFRAAASRLLPKDRWRPSWSPQERCCGGIAVGGEALDVRASRWPPTDATRGARAGTPSCAREPAVGVSTDCRRVEGSWSRRLSDDGAHLAAGCGSRTSRPASGHDMAGIRTDAPAQPARGRFLDGQDDLATAALRASASAGVRARVGEAVVTIITAPRAR
jgi:hypothetical protein